MSLNIKSEPIDETSIVDLSSEEDELVSTNRNDMPNIMKHPDRPGTPETNCSICLDELNNKSYSDSCWHMFCYECLKRWSMINSSCPLCKKSFRSIYHTFTDQGIHETYNVPPQERDLSPRTIRLRPFSEISDVNRHFRMNLFLDIIRRNERLMNNLNFGGQDQNHNHSLRIGTATRYVNVRPNYNNHPYMRILPQNGEAMRIQVYSENMWADPLPDLSGRFRECSSNFYRENPAQMHRLYSFIHRDIIAIRAIERSSGTRRQTNLNESHLTDMIMQTILGHEIRGSYLNELLQPYFGEYTEHFIHELYNFANSPYDLVGYDRNVLYVSRHGLRPHSYPEITTESIYDVPQRFIDSPPPSIPLIPRYLSDETIVLDSDDDDEHGTNSRINGQVNEVIVLSSSSEDDSDIEIIPQSFHPTETLDSSRDQPSTSTGIRDSLNPQNTRYNLRRRRLRPTLNDRCSCGEVHLTHDCDIRLSRGEVFPLSGLGRTRISLDSSSSDDDTPVVTRVTRPSVDMKSGGVVLGRRKRKMKKTKPKKRKTTVGESQIEVHIGNRSRSHSSSSSSGETDSTMPANNHIPMRTSVFR